MNRSVPGIKWKLFGYLLGFCLLLLIILALFQTVFLDRFYVGIKQRQVNQVIASVSSYVRTEDWDGLSEATRDPGDVFVEIWSLESGLVSSSGSFQDGIHTQLKPEEMGEIFAQVSQQNGSLTRYYQNRDKKGKKMRESIVSAQLVESSDGKAYMALVSAGLSPVKATVDTLRVQLAFISGIMLALSIGLALLISRKVSGPIEAISRTAGELGRGRYDVVFRGSGYKEVVQLADALTEAAMELSKTEELRRELIANVSHDLRTPLTLIAGYGEMIRDMPGEATPENLQVIIDETNRLSTLVSDLLDLSKLQAGTEKFAAEPFDLAELAEEIVGRMSRFCEPEGYRIVFDPADPVPVRGDRERIAQVIYNFLLNAVTHTGPDKGVAVSLKTSDDSARLEVTDSGEGISPEELPYIWERYYKVDKSHQRSESGSGLGLSIVRSILDRHPGVDYGAESQSGQGSTFWFSMERGQPLPPR